MTRHWKETSSLGPAGSRRLNVLVSQVVRCSQDAGSYGLPADVWAAGVAVYEMLIGGAPFEASSKEATYSKILTSQPFMPSHLHPQAQDFLKRVRLVREPRLLA